MLKIKWRVGTRPSGRYGSFQGWSWPTAEYSNQRVAAWISCEDDYSPSRARGEAKHAPLVIYVADHRAVTDAGHPAFKRLKVKAEAASLEEAKKKVSLILALHPEFAPKDLVEVQHASRR
jgi:hypothetical protein